MFCFSSPALLQSTVKLFFCPSTALDRPAPRQTTLLASDVSLAEETEAEEAEAEVEAEEAEEEEL